MKNISTIIGLVLLLISFTLAYLSNSNVEQMNKNKKGIVTKYITKSKIALENGDHKVAIKFAKLAIIANPESKDGFKIYEEIMEAKYPKNQTNFSTHTTPSGDEEDEEDMGC